MKKIFCFGELLLRHSVDSNGSWIQQHSLPVYLGGAELNVAIALAKWKLPVKYCTALPEDYLSEQLISYLTEINIDTSAVQHMGERVGIYYLREGTDLKGDAVIYDRANSSFSNLKPGIIDWNEVLSDVSWFHFSAISPALNNNIADVCLEAVKVATEKGLTISIDLNYRQKLWKDRDPKSLIPELLQYCDVIMGNIWSVNKLAGGPIKDLSKHDNEEYLEQSISTADFIKKNFPKTKIVANIFRLENNGNIEYFSSVDIEGQQITSRKFNSNLISSRVGSGDCYMAGLIYGLYNQHSNQQLVDFSTAAGFGKLFEEGDHTNQDIQAVMQRLNHE